MVEKQLEEEKCPMLRPKGLHIGQGLTPHPIAGLSWTGVQLANSIKVAPTGGRLQSQPGHRKSNLDIQGTKAIWEHGYL